MKKKEEKKKKKEEKKCLHEWKGYGNWWITSKRICVKCRMILEIPIE